MLFLGCATCLADRGSLASIAQTNAILIMLAFLGFVFGVIFLFIRYLMKCEKRSLQHL